MKDKNAAHGRECAPKCSNCANAKWKVECVRSNAFRARTTGLRTVVTGVPVPHIRLPKMVDLTREAGTKMENRCVLEAYCASATRQGGNDNRKNTRWPRKISSTTKTNKKAIINRSKRTRTKNSSKCVITDLGVSEMEPVLASSPSKTSDLGETTNAKNTEEDSRSAATN